jgi:hypothetical protein
VGTFFRLGFPLIEAAYRRQMAADLATLKTYSKRTSDWRGSPTDPRARLLRQLRASVLLVRPRWAGKANPLVLKDHELG